MKSRISLLVILCHVVFRSFSQDCGAEILHRQRIATDQVYAKTAEENAVLFRKAVIKQKASAIIGSYYGMQATIYTIPVVVHVLHTGGAEGTAFNPSTTIINEAIDYLNNTFAGTLPDAEGVGEIGIQFALATRDPNNNPTTGITRQNVTNSDYVSFGVRLQGANGLTDLQLKNIIRWDPGLYYNIWVVNKIDGASGGPGPFVAGYALYPGFHPYYDGTVMLASQMKADAKTLPHEIGHALGVAHTFENFDNPAGTTCPVDTACAINGDQVCDTDPVTVGAFASRMGNINSCNGAPYSINTEHNIMSYTEVFTLFTAGQRDRMLAAMSFPARASLARSWAIAGAYPYSFSGPVAASCTPVSDAFGLSGGYAGLLGVAVENRQFSSGITATDPGYVDKSSSPLHLVPLAPNVGYSLSTDLLTGNASQVAVYIDYNSDGIFNNSTERILYADGIPGGPQITRVTSSFVVPASAVANTVLRMRVINELAAGFGTFIDSACYNPYFGQAEDFPVYITSILPVSWKYFTGTRTGEDIVLTWATSTETNNHRFDVERSTDGATFTTISSVAAHGAGREYRFVDKSADQPVYFYRIVQVDLNGNQKRTNTIIVRNDEYLSNQVLRVANPFNDHIDLVLDNAFTVASTIRLFDANGRQVLSDLLPAGQKTWRVREGVKLAPGFYLLKVQSGNTVLTKKLIRQ
jgi:hypothetical protein